MNRRHWMVFFLIAIIAWVTIPSYAEPITAEQSLAYIIEGNQRYLQELNDPDLSLARREALATKQHPFAVIVGCSDSRVPPEHIFDQGLGDLFVIRLAGNVVDTLAVGSVEYAIAELGVPLVVVLGHEGCGAIKASVHSHLHDAGVDGGIAAIVGLIQPSVASVLETSTATGTELYERVTDANIMSVIEHLLQSEIIQKAAQEGILSIVGAKHHSSGEVVLLP